MDCESKTAQTADADLFLAVEAGFGFAALTRHAVAVGIASSLCVEDEAVCTLKTARETLHAQLARINVKHQEQTIN